MSKVWSPQPRQAEFMSRWEDEALYGGAAGGGKTDCALIEALRQVHIPHYKALLLRKTYPQLKDMIDRSIQLYPRAFPDARYNDSKHLWKFPSGAQVIFGNLQHSKDKYNYQGQHYDFIDFDELTQFTYDEYMYLHSRNRPNGAGTRCYIRAQANPGGIGHAWVKERFITPAPPMQTIWEEVEVKTPEGKTIQKRKSRIFVPSTVFDNKILLENDSGYLLRLASMPEAEKRALLYGDWDSFSGQVFSEWVNDADHYKDRKNTHVIEPFLVPNDWKVLRSFDWGYAKPFSVGWWAVDTKNRLYRIRELYGCKGEPDVGVKWEPHKVAQEIKRIESEDPNLRGRHIRGVADPAIYQENGGVSVADAMQSQGVYWDKADHNRIAGKMQMHHRLAFDERGIPLMYIFSTCKHFIRTVPALVYDETDVEDVNTNQEDHIYDEARYMCMLNPINPPRYDKHTIKPYNPLESEKLSRYDYYL